MDLDEAEQAVLRTGMAPLLRDLRASGAIVPDVLEQAWDRDTDSVTAYLQPPGSAGTMTSGTTRIRVLLTDDHVEGLVYLAEQVQDWEVEELWGAGRPATWPECPPHPGSHPLSAQVRDGAAVWCCPRSGDAIRVIGEL